eukprot:TRINITY_DN4038_c0_g1_i1.p2 TRINITY_DN4038_c0_g1~~TRINITY_DN4038_c0_g1_i1.p2  ORF type:complete len:492 (-),score=73.70 TRINITY_DN4038_c0_g1_i1:8-1483(-)
MNRGNSKHKTRPQSRATINGQDISTLKALITELHAALPLSVCHPSVRPFPWLADPHLLEDTPVDRKPAAFLASVSAILLALRSERSAEILFARDPALARAAAELLLALLQHRRSFGDWQDPEKNGTAVQCPRPLSAHIVFKQVIEHVARWHGYSLVPLLTAHAVPITSDLLADPEIDQETAVDCVIQPIAELVNTDPVGSIGEFAAALYAGGPFAVLTANLSTNPSAPPVTKQYATMALAWICAVLHQLDKSKRRAPVHQPRGAFVVFGTVMKNPKSPWEQVIMCARSVGYAYTWSNTMGPREDAEMVAAMLPAFETGLADVLGIVLSALEAAHNDPTADDLRSVCMWFVVLMIHWAIDVPKDQGTQWRVQTLAEVFTVRSSGGKSVADFLLAKETTGQPGGIATGVRGHLLTFARSGVRGDPSAIDKIRAFLDDPRWRRSQCGNKTCGKTWDDTMKKCARCQLVSYCGTSQCFSLAERSMCAPCIGNGNT